MLHPQNKTMQGKRKIHLYSVIQEKICLEAKPVENLWSRLHNTCIWK